MADYRVTVGVDVIYDELNKAEQKIRKLDGSKVDIKPNIKMDTKGFKHKMKPIAKELSEEVDKDLVKHANRTGTTIKNVHFPKGTKQSVVDEYVEVLKERDELERERARELEKSIKDKRPFDTSVYDRAIKDAERRASKIAKDAGATIDTIHPDKSKTKQVSKPKTTKSIQSTQQSQQAQDDTQNKPVQDTQQKPRRRRTGDGKKKTSAAPEITPEDKAVQDATGEYYRKLKARNEALDSLNGKIKKSGKTKEEYLATKRGQQAFEKLSVAQDEMKAARNNLVGLAKDFGKDGESLAKQVEDGVAREREEKGKDKIPESTKRQRRAAAKAAEQQTDAANHSAKNAERQAQASGKSADTVERQVRSDSSANKVQKEIDDATKRQAEATDKSADAARESAQSFKQQAEAAKKGADNEERHAQRTSDSNEQVERARNQVADNVSREADSVREKVDTTPSPASSSSERKPSAGTSSSDSSLNELKDKTVDVKVNLKTEQAQQELNSFISTADSKTIDIAVDAKTEQAKSDINSLLSMYDSKTIDITVDADTERAKSEINLLGSKADSESAKIDLGADLTKAKQTINTLSSYAKGKTVKVDVDASLTSAKKTINTLSAYAKGKTVKVDVDANLAPAKRTINTLSALAKGKTVKVNVDADTDMAKTKINEVVAYANSLTARIDIDADTESLGKKIKSQVNKAVKDTDAKLSDGIDSDTISAPYARARKAQESAERAMRQVTADEYRGQRGSYEGNKYYHYNKPITNSKEAFTEARHFENMLGTVRRQLKGVDKDSDYGKELAEQLRFLENEKSKIYKDWNNQWTTKQKNDLKRIKQRNAFSLDATDAKLSSKEFEEMRNFAYDRAKFVEQTIANNKKKRVGLSDDDGFARILDFQNEILERELTEINSEFGEHWTKRQKASLNKVKDKSEIDLEQKGAQEAEKQKKKDADDLANAIKERAKAQAELNKLGAKENISGRSTSEEVKRNQDIIRDADKTIEELRTLYGDDLDNYEQVVEAKKDAYSKVAGSEAKAFDDMVTAENKSREKAAEKQDKDNAKRLADAIKERAKAQAEIEKLEAKGYTSNKVTENQIANNRGIISDSDNVINELSQNYGQSEEVAEARKEAEKILANAKAKAEDDMLDSDVKARAKKKVQDRNSLVKDLEDAYRERAEADEKIAKIRSKHDILDSERERVEIDELARKSQELRDARSRNLADANARLQLLDGDTSQEAELQRKAAERYIQEYDKEIRDIESEITRRTERLNRVFDSDDAEKLKFQQRRRATAQETIDAAHDILRNSDSDLTDDEQKKLRKIEKDAQQRIEDMYAAERDARNKRSADILNDLNKGQYQKKNNSLLDSVRQLRVESDATFDSVSRLDKAYENLLSAARTGDVDKIVDADKEYARALRDAETSAAIDALDRENVVFDEEGRLSGRSFKQKSRDESFMNRHSSVVEDIDGTTKRSSQMLNEYSESLDKLDKQYGKFGGTIRRVGIGMLASFGAEALVQGLMMMVREVMAVDSAMIELKRVTDLTNEGYDKLYDDMVASSKEYGATLSDTIQSTSEWVRLGFNPETEAVKLSEVSAMYQHIADVDVSTANDNLVTAYKGFEDSLLEAYDGNSARAIEYAADIYNDLGNKFALSSADVGAGLSRAASALSVGGNTIQESAAMVTGITEVTQDPEKAGNALKIVSMRLRGMKGELEQIESGAGEGVESISKMQTQILNMTNGKVNIFDDNGEFKSTYEILGGIAEVWDELNSVDQATLLETIAGKNRANDTAALLSNWENVEDAMLVATNAEGSASAEHEKYMESIQGHVDKLMSSWQAFSAAFLNTDLVIGFVDGLSAFLDALTGLIDGWSELNPIVKTFITTIGVLAVGMGILTKLFGGLKFTSFANFFSQMGSAISMLAPASFGAAGGITALGAAFKSLAIASVVALAITAVISAISYLAGYEDKLNDRVDNTIAKFKEQNDALKESKKLLSESGQRYAELSKGVDRMGNNLSLTSEEYAEYQDLSNQIGEALPSLVQGHDIEGNIILSVKGEIEGLEEAQKEAQKKANDIVIDDPTTNEVESADIVKAFNMSRNDLAMPIEQYNMLDELLNTDDIDATVDKYAEESYVALQNLEKQLINEGFEREFGETSQDFISRIVKENNLALDDLLYESEKEMGKYSEGMRTLAEAYLSNELMGDKFENMSEDMRSTITSLIPNMDYEFFSQFGTDQEMFDYFDKMLAQFDSLSPENEKAFTIMLNLESQLNNGEITVGEYVQGVEDFNGAISTLPEDVQEMIKITYGIEEEDSILESRQNLIDDLTGDLGMSVDVAEFFTDNLSGNKMTATLDLIAEGQIDTDMIQQYEDEINKLKELSNVTGLNPFTEQFGNVDFSNADRVIEWNEKNLEKYKSQLMSWNEFQKDENGKFIIDENGKKKKSTWKQVQDEYAGSVSTVEGMSKTIEGVDIAYTPYLETDDGLELLSKDTVDSYIDGIFKKAKEDDGKVDAAELLSFDMTGLEIDGKRVSNILAGVGRNARDIGEMMHYAGENGQLAMTELMQVIEREAKVQQALSYEIDIEAETSGIESVKTALTETMGATGVTETSVAALTSRFAGLSSSGKTVTDLFEATATGLRMNTDVFYELEDALATQQLDETTGHLETMKEELGRVEKTIKDASSTTEEVSWAMGRRDELLAHMNLLGQQAALYEGLTNKYAEWQRAEAEDTGNNRDMYESVLTGHDTVKDELSRGWADDGTIKYLELLTGRTDLAGKTLQEVRGVFKSLDKDINSAGYSINDFFTVDSEGNSTSEGVWNFLDTINAEGGKIGKAVTKHKDGSYTFDFEVAGGDEAIAEALGISEELVDIMLNAAKDAGFEVNFEGQYEEYAKIVSSAEQAQKDFNNINKSTADNVDFDFSSSDLETVVKQAEDAKNLLDQYKRFTNKEGDAYLKRNKQGEVIDQNGNVLEGGKEALEMASTLQMTKDRLSDPVYMSIDASTLSDELQEPTEKLQEYDRLLAKQNQLELKGHTGSKAYKENAEAMEETYEYFKKIRDEGGDLAESLGIDDMSDTELQTALDNQTLTIPTELELTASIDESLQQLVDIAKIEKGLLDPVEVPWYFEEKTGAKIDGIDFSKYDDTNVDSDGNTEVDIVTKFVTDEQELLNTLSGKGRQIVVDFYISNPEVWNELSEDEKDVVINFVENNKSVLSQYSEGDQQKLIDFRLANPEAFNSWLNLSEDQRKIVFDAVLANPDFLEGYDESYHPVLIELIATNPDFFTEYTDAEQKVVIDYVTENGVEAWNELGEDGQQKYIKANVGTVPESTEQVEEDVRQATKEGASEGTSEGVSEGFTFKVKDEEQKKAFDDAAKEFEEYAKQHGYEVDIPEFKVEGEGSNSEGSGKGKDSDGSAEKPVKFKPDVSELEGYEIEEREAIVEFTTYADEVNSYTPEQKQAIVEYEAQYGDVDNYTPEEKEAIAKYLADPTEIENFSPEQKEAVARYLAEHGDIDRYSPEQKQAIARYLLNSANVDSYTPAQKQAIAKYLKDSGLVDSYVMPQNKTATARYNKDSSAVDGYNPPNIFRSVIYSIINRGSNQVDGTAHINGTAFANGTANSNNIGLNNDISYAQQKYNKKEKKRQRNLEREYKKTNEKYGEGKAFRSGNWGIGNSGVALGGELGQELVVRDGRFFTIGDDSAEFFSYKKDDIIFNAEQTKQIFAKGRITHGKRRGNALASGSAFAGGTVSSSGRAFAPGSHGGGGGRPTFGDSTSKSSSGTGSSGNNKSSNNKSNNKDTKSTKDDTKEVFDWIEVLIDRIERLIERLGKTADSVYKTWAQRNKAISQSIAKTRKEIDLQWQGYNRYIKQANGVKISKNKKTDAKYKQLVQEGKIDIETIKNEKLAEKIKEYQEW